MEVEQKTVTDNIKSKGRDGGGARDSVTGNIKGKGRDGGGARDSYWQHKK